MPTQADPQTATDNPQVTIEVIVRKDVIEIGDGKVVTTSIPKLNMKHDYQKLSENLMRLKESYRDKQDVIILIEPDIEYESMIQVMDAVKVVEVKKAGQEKTQTVVLFPQVSIGDAP